MLELYILAAAVLLASYLYTRLNCARFQQYAYLPQLPSHLLWGHLKTFGEFTQRGISDRHPDEIFEEMWATKGRPPIMFVDFRPINPPLLLITSHSIAEQVSKPSSLLPFGTPKSPTWHHMIPLIGSASVFSREGNEWKNVRKRYNPGFARPHLWSLLPLILEKTNLFFAHLDHFVASKEEFSLEKLISNLTFDIIGTVVLQVDLNAQHLDRSKQGEVIRLFTDLLQTYNDDKNNFPWWVVPLTAMKRKRLAKRIDMLVKETIKQKYAEFKAEGEVKRPRNVVAFSFQETETLTPQFLSELSDQVRTFLFAGHDTVTTTLLWAFYELSRTPHALKAVRDELDKILEPETDHRAICTALSQKGETVLQKMHYVNAVIKETLRLHAPAATVRMTAPGTGFTLQTPTGEHYAADGLILYPCQHIIHRDPSVYGETADYWIPERWLSEAAQSIPVSAWRPFERGPRNCMGLGLANIEARAIIALVARKYDFVKTGLGESLLNEKGHPILNEKGQYRVRSELYNTRRMTAKPVDGTMMRIELASG